MASKTDKVLVEKLNGVACITFNDPRRRNPLSLEVMEGTVAVLNELAHDPEVQVVITTGAGESSYIGGLDVTELATVWRQPESPEPVFLDMVKAFREFPKITIAMVNGYCLGGGMTILLAQDLAIASDRAKIGLPEIFRGFTPRYATAAVFRAISPRLAFEMLLTGKNLDAHQAERAGLINRVADHDQLRAETFEWAQQMAGFDPLTVQFSKRAAYECMDQLTFDQAIKISSLIHLEHNAVNTKSFEGLVAFVEGAGQKADQ